MLSLLGAAISSIAAEYFMAGTTAAITLYCGIKLPRDKRKWGNSLIEINTIDKVEDILLPEYIKDKIRSLFRIYGVTDLSEYGGVYIAEKEDDLKRFEDKTVEVVEKILCEEDNIYHALYIHNNDFSTNVYAYESILTNTIKGEWDKNIVLKVYEDEFQ